MTAICGGPAHKIVVIWLTVPPRRCEFSRGVKSTSDLHIQLSMVIVICLLSNRYTFVPDMTLADPLCTVRTAPKRANNFKTTNLRVSGAVEGECVFNGRRA